MKPLNLDDVREYASTNIEYFYQCRIASLKQLKLSRLLQRNPYLFGSKDILIAWDLMEDLLTRFLTSSEDKYFTNFLKGLAFFVADKTCNARKSAMPGVDLEFVNHGTYYIVSVKSGLNWENSSRHRKFVQGLGKATSQVRQEQVTLAVQPVLGICYGKMHTTNTPDGYLKVVGRNFWYLISESETLYTDIIEPIGYRIREYIDTFDLRDSGILNRFTKEFMEKFCNDTGTIDWLKVVTFNSGNYDLEELSQ